MESLLLNEKVGIGDRCFADLISISLCADGGAGLVCRQLQSLLNQAHRYLEIVVWMIRPHVKLSCDSLLIDADGKQLDIRMSDKWPMPNVYSLVPFVMGNCVSSHAMMFRRELLQSALPIPEGFFHDWWLAAVAASVLGIVYCSQALVLYRQHDNNVTDVLGRRDPVGLTPDVGIKKADAIWTRMVVLLALPGVQQKYLGTWLSLWQRRNNQWFCPMLSLHLFRSAKDVFLFTRATARGQLTAPPKYLFGLRLKRVLRPDKYAVEASDR